MIISQTPSQGEKLSKGSIISVDLSLGKKSRILPEIVGLNLAEASEKVASEGFIPENIDSFDENVEAGLVIGYKDHMVGETLDAGSKVSIIVSKGKQTDFH